MKYYGFWVSSRPIPPKRKIKCQICGEKTKSGYPIDCVLRNNYWINSAYFCLNHSIEELKKWISEHSASYNDSNNLNYTDGDIFTEYEEWKEITHNGVLIA